MQALADAAELSRRLADGLGTLAKRSGASLRAAEPIDTPGAAASEAAVATPSPRRERSTRPRVPSGLVADSPEGVEAILQTPGLVLVVDGYNLSMRAWPDAAPAL